MADVKISALPAASTPLAGTEVLPIVQGGTTDKVSVANLTAGRTVAAGALNVSGTTRIDAINSAVDIRPGASDFNSVVWRSTNGATTYANMGPEAAGSGSLWVNGATNVYLATGGTERMRIDASGNVGIGTSSPDERLTLQANAGAAAFTIKDSGGTTRAYIGVDGAFGSAPTGALRIRSDQGGIVFGFAGAEQARITAGGEVYIAGTTDQGAFNLQVNGTGVWGAGAYVNGSDRRIKDDIAPITSGLDVVAKLNPVQFRYKESWSKDRALQPGFIAQELQEALADQPYAEGVVHQGPEYMSVSYQTLIPVLVKAVQELKAENDALKARIATLETR